MGSAAKRLGIYLCLENLAWGWTGRPELYEKLVRKADCLGTIDIGHAEVCHSIACRAYDFADFAIPHPEKILGAHIYHKETSDGHVPPSEQSDLEERLNFLLELPLCNWWVLELRDEDSLLQTLQCVKNIVNVA